MAAKRNYLYNDKAVSQLAREYVEGADKAAAVSESYLKVLVAHSQRELKATKTAAQESMVGAVTAANERLYAVVMAAVVTQDIKHEETLPPAERTRRAKERNRRTGFARSAKSTLVNYVRSGGKLHIIDAATATKEMLQQAYRQNVTPDLPGQIKAAERRILALLRQLAEQDKAAASTQVDALEQALRQAVAVKPVTAATRRVRDITLHPH